MRNWLGFRPLSGGDDQFFDRSKAQCWLLDDQANKGGLAGLWRSENGRYILDTAEDTVEEFCPLVGSEVSPEEASGLLTKNNYNLKYGLLPVKMDPDMRGAEGPIVTVPVPEPLTAPEHVEPKSKTDLTAPEPLYRANYENRCLYFRGQKEPINMGTEARLAFVEAILYAFKNRGARTGGSWITWDEMKGESEEEQPFMMEMSA